MNHPIQSDDFFGGFGLSYKDENIIYAYDCITHGLYKFSLELKEVSLVLSSRSIHRNKKDRIRGITKSWNEIVLIPASINSEWIFYDIKTQKVRYDTPIKKRGNISGTRTIEKNLFLVPFDTSSPIIIVSLESMEIVRLYENWYKESGGKGERKEIWGDSSYGEIIIFPISKSKNLVCLDNGKLNVIALNIPFPVLSVSIWEDRIWVLPMEGGCIYAVDLEGNIMDKIFLPDAETDLSARVFSRIIAIDENVFLLPEWGEIIYVYRYKMNKFVQIKGEKKQIFINVFAQNIVAYWNYIIENRKLYLLPILNQFKCINLDSLESKNYSLKYGNNINEDAYWKMISGILADYILKEKESTLEAFIRFVLYSHEKLFMKENSKNGKRIWKSV